ncbi:AAA family ATPase [Brachybacterium sp. NPDC056505]|uniref:AAA family ATPase n=1 Tax=Brachybacterium sp. NPDC056505 TaxID=3345843 RepID=UPI0036716447
MITSFSLNSPYRALDIESINALRLKRFNIIFGRNGSGKTSFTELIREHAYDPANSSVIEHQTTNVADSCEIVVFNRYVVEQSLRDFSSGTGSAASIALGKSNVNLKEQQRKLEHILNERRDWKEGVVALQGKTASESAVSKRAKERVIEHMEGIAPGFNNAQYRNDARLRGKIRDAAPNSADPSIAELKRKIPSEGLKGSDYVLPRLTKTLAKLPEEKEVESIISARSTSVGASLETASRALLSWLEEGLQYHSESTDQDCPFCTQNPPAERLEEIREALASESTAIRNRGTELVRNIHDTVEALDQIEFGLNSLHLGDPTHQERLNSAVSKFRPRVKQFKDDWLSVAQALTDKVADLDLEMILPALPSPLSYPLDLETVLSDYESLVATQDRQRTQAIDRLETRILSDFHDALHEAELTQNRMNRCIARIEYSISKIDSELLQTIRDQSDTAEMALRLTEDLQVYGGLSALQVVPTKDNKSYSVYRSNGEQAENLSDGERNLLSFFYFLRSLEDIALEGKNLVVAIDDPMTSLDSENIHVLTQMITRAWGDWDQVILSTHSHSFFYELVNSVPESVTKNDELLLLETFASGAADQVSPLWGIRTADELRVTLSSEYHYAFWCTAQAAAGDVDEIYLSSFGNSARRLLEGFASFRRPATKNLRQSLESSWASKKDLSPMSAVLQSALSFANEHSHDRTAAPKELGWRAASKRDFSLVLYVVYALDSDHFEQMLKSFPDCNNFYQRVEGVLKPFKGAYCRSINGVDPSLEKILG